MEKMPEGTLEKTKCFSLFEESYTFNTFVEKEILRPSAKSQKCPCQKPALKSESIKA